MESADYLVKFEDISTLEPGVIIRRQSDGKIQQGGFVKLTDEKDGVILINVVDLENDAFAAEGGIIRPGEGDELFRHVSRFGESSSTDAARAVLTGWSVYGKHPNLQGEMMEFMESAYSPEHVLDLKKTDELARLFVPLQQKFKIGKFTEKTDWNKVRFERFKTQLAEMEDGKHMTYVAFIPREGSHQPMFYSIGTKPHLETMTRLKDEGFAFRPNNGGHIKVISAQNETPKRFLVDAGSNDLGSGVHTSLAVAEMITEALKKVYPENEYEPMAGRGAFGIQQSY